MCVPNLVVVRRSCRKKGGYRQTDKWKLQLYIDVSHPGQDENALQIEVCYLRVKNVDGPYLKNPSRS